MFRPSRCVAAEPGEAGAAGGEAAPEYLPGEPRLIFWFIRNPLEEWHLIDEATSRRYDGPDLLAVGDAKRSTGFRIT